MCIQHRAFSNCPCKGCTDRHSLCHGECERYKEWHAKSHSEYKQYRERKHVENYDVHEAITGRRKNRVNIWKK